MYVHNNIFVALGFILCGSKKISMRDKQNKFCRNAMKRDAAWSMVAKQMDTTGKYALYFPSIFRRLFGNFHISFPLFC